MTRDQLADIPGLADEAWLTWGTQAASGEAVRTRRRTDTGLVLADLDRLLVASLTPPRPIPARVWHYPAVKPAERAKQQAIDATLQQRHASVGSLFGWVHVHHDDETAAGIETWLPNDDVASVCTWLTARLDWAADQEWWSEYCDDIRLLWGQLRAVCRVRAEYHPRCRKCASRVILVDGRGYETSPEAFSHGACAGCGATYPKGPAMDALGQLQEFTLAELAERVCVPLGTLHRWHQSGVIRPTTSPDVRRGRLFSLDAVMRAVERLRGTGGGERVGA